MSFFVFLFCFISAAVFGQIIVVETENGESVVLVPKKNAEKNQKKLQEDSDFYRALEKGQVQKLEEYFQSKKGKFDLSKLSPTGETFLYYSLKNKTGRSFKWLLDKGFDINQKNRFGVTVLEMAVLKNDLKLAKKLVSRGADVNQVDELGWTLLHTASSSKSHESVEMIKFLLTKIENPNLLTESGKSSLVFAVHASGSDGLALENLKQFAASKKVDLNMRGESASKLSQADRISYYAFVDDFKKTIEYLLNSGKFNLLEDSFFKSINDIDLADHPGNRAALQVSLDAKGEVNIRIHILKSLVIDVKEAVVRQQGEVNNKKDLSQKCARSFWQTSFKW